MAMATSRMESPARVHTVAFTYNDTQQRLPGHQRQRAQALPTAVPQCEFVRYQMQLDTTANNTTPSSHREHSPEPRLSPHLTTHYPPRNGDYERQALPSPSPPFAMHPQSLRLPRPGLHQHPRRLSLSPPASPRPHPPLLLPTTSTQSPWTTSKSQPPTTSLAAFLKDSGS
jgi:hypothetical protein